MNGDEQIVVHNTRRPVVRWALMFLVITGLVGAVITPYCYYLNRFNRLTFNQDLWDTDPQGVTDLRYQMLDDLIKNHLKAGLHRSRVIKLMGSDFYDEGEWLRWHIGDFRPEYYERPVVSSRFDKEDRLIESYYYFADY